MDGRQGTSARGKSGDVVPIAAGVGRRGRGRTSGGGWSISVYDSGSVCPVSLISSGTCPVATSAVGEMVLISCMIEGVKG